MRTNLRMLGYALSFFFLFGFLAASAASVGLTGAETSSDGTVHLEFDILAGSEGQMVELQQDRHPDFPSPLLRYRGSEAATYLTGLSPSKHYFRARVVGVGMEENPWSAPHLVTVRYLPRRQLVTLLAVGSFVALSIVLAIVGGSLRTRKTGA